MKIFISYSRKDETAAHLLAHILSKNRIDCLIDRQLQAGEKFDVKLQQMIRDSDLVLVLLTKASAESKWVNQEIGFAIGIAKPVFPLAIESDAPEPGMIQMTHEFPLFDWSDPDHAIKRLVKALRDAAQGLATSDKQLGFDRLLEGRVARANFLATHLGQLAKRKSGDLVILHQAAFSIFSASDDALYRDAPGHTPEVVEAQLEEKAAWEALVARPNCSLKLLLWPVRAYEPRYLAVRYANLLAWLRKVKENPAIDFACGHYPGPNRLIVVGEMVIEGFKLHNHPGYELTRVKYRPDQIVQAAAEFRTAFAKTAGGKEAVIERIRQELERLL